MAKAVVAAVVPLFRPAAQATGLVVMPPVAHPTKPRVAAPAAGRLSSAQQWQKVSDVLTGAVASATSARTLHSDAAQQLDLATYGLYKILDELAPILSEPLARDSAVVHRLPTKRRAVHAHALAA